MDTLAAGSNIMQSVRSLLAGAIDYAGLFPPAGLSMPEAVINYATYRTSNYSWMLGRFVVNAGRLQEFYENAADFISHDAVSAWRLAVIAGDDGIAAARAVGEFNATRGPGVVCDMIEIRPMTAYEIENVSQALPEGVTAYFELEFNDELPRMLATVAAAGQRAKLRTGGVTANAFPRSADIVRFVQACVAANVPFKATAGLHHPIRCYSPLTYENNSPSGTMHGFLNLFLMTGFACEGYRKNLLEELMEEEFAEVFAFEDQSAVWRHEFRLNIAQIERLRVQGIHSFGSCSFDEPVSDLQKLGIL